MTLRELRGVFPPTQNVEIAGFAQVESAYKGLNMDIPERFLDIPVFSAFSIRYIDILQITLDVEEVA